MRTDWDLIDRAKRGDQKSLDELYRKYYKHLIKNLFFNN